MIRPDDENLEIDYSTNFKDDFLKNLQNAHGSLKKTSTLSTQNIYGIKNLNVSTIYFENIHKKKVDNICNKVYDVEYTINLNENYELKIIGEYLNERVSVIFFIIQKQQKWSIGFDFNLILNPLGLCENGFHVVANIPIFGIQFLLKYNVANRNVHVTFRLPNEDQYEGDKKDAAIAKCALILLTFDFVYEKVNQLIYEFEDIENCATQNSSFLLLELPLATEYLGNLINNLLGYRQVFNYYFYNHKAEEE